MFKTSLPFFVSELRWSGSTQLAAGQHGHAGQHKVGEDAQAGGEPSRPGTQNNI